MSNDQCHVGSANRAKIDAQEHRIAELSDTLEEMCRRWDESQQALLGRMDRLHEELTNRFDRIVERFANRPSWAVMVLLSGLSALCVGLIVYSLGAASR